MSGFGYHVLGFGAFPSRDVVAGITGNATNVSAKAQFDATIWASSTAKILNISSGVTLGGTSGTAALTIEDDLGGSLLINNAGTVIGTGGASAGAAGGHAINCAVSGVTINNTGQISGGGGAGNVGGVGGNGSTTQTTVSTRNSYPSSTWQFTTGAWSGVGSWTHPGGATSKSFGGHTFYRGAYAGTIGEAAYYQIIGHIVSTVSTSGGAGGSFGVGAGYGQSATNGGSGSSGGTNAGAGGAGSDGAALGTAAATSSAGGNGNVSNGAAGNAGGAAGAAVTGTSVTMNNSGTLHGAVA